MRFMDWIRRKGGTCMAVFLVMFVITLFAGLTISGVSMRGCSFQPRQEEPTAGGRITLSTDKALANVVLTVNEQPVKAKLYNERVNQLLEEYRRRSEDPVMQLYAFGNAANSLVAEEVMFEKGQDLDVRVTDQDMAEARDEVINQMLASDTGTTGNVLGDIAQKIGSRRERKAAFYQYLEVSGLTESQWRETARRGLFIQKTREAWQEVLDEEKAREAAETKAIIDQRLADGESFADLAAEYSEDPSATSEPIPMGRGLVLPEQEEPLFNTPVGELTDWIEIPAGWNRFEITDKKLAEGEEFEAQRERIVENLKGDKEDYEPTEEEIKRQYETVTARQILLKTTNPGAVDTKLEELINQAHVAINDPYVLAFQSLNEDKLQPISGFDYDKLVGIAQTATVGEDYDFGLIERALERGHSEFENEPPAEAEGEAVEVPVAEDEAVADDEGAAESAESDAGETQAEAGAAADESDAAEATDEPATNEEPEEEHIPIYALAIGMFKLAIQDQVDKVGPFPYYMIGRIYTDWLADEDHQEQQPIDREKARQEVEDNYGRAAEGMDYNYVLHAERGLNLAWLERKDEALASLDLAIKYAPQDYQLPVWDKVREAYEVLDDQEKLDEFNSMIDGYRQAALQEMIEQQKRQQEQQQQPITIPMDSDGAEDSAADDTAETGDEATGDSETAGGEEAAGGESEESDSAAEEQPEESAPPESTDGEEPADN
jgi:parvulin-like peptidyl-prolyl isomerase